MTKTLIFAVTCLSILSGTAQARPVCVSDAIMIHPSRQFYFGQTFSSFDTNTDARVSFDEFLARSGYMDAAQPEARKVEVMRIFLEKDQDQDGYLLREDWPKIASCKSDEE